MQPLASRIRPETLDGFVGQGHLVGEGKPLREAIEKKHLLKLGASLGLPKSNVASIYDHVESVAFTFSAEAAHLGLGKDRIVEIQRRIDGK